MSKLTINVKQRTLKGETPVTVMEGVYQLPASTSAKLSRKDGTTQFPTRSSLAQAAKRLATAIGWEVELVDAQKKVAAKKSVKKAAAKKTTAKKAAATTETTQS